MAAGLQSEIWNNNIRSIVLLALYPLIIMLLIWIIAYLLATFQGGYHIERYDTPTETVWLNTGNPEYVANTLIAHYWPSILTVIALWFVVAYFFNTAMIRKLSHAHSVTREQEPELYNLLENLCISRGMKMPKLNIIETHARNAFASGIDERSYTVTVTRGLLNSLQRDEVEGVLAHELTHIRNRDVRLLMVCVIFTGMIGFAAQMMWSNLRYGMIMSRGNRGGRGSGGAVIFILTIAIVLWIGYLATLFTRFAISRRREFMADAGAVEMTKNPEAMMRALMRIARRDQIPETTGDVMMMCIENAKPFMGLFMTHPPIERRIEAISKLTATPVPQMAHHGPTTADLSFGDRKRPNPWLIRERR